MEIYVINFILMNVLLFLE